MLRELYDYLGAPLFVLALCVGVVVIEGICIMAWEIIKEIFGYE